MKRQITQFDNDRTNATVATPTCSSCCCCCCCLVTTLTSSTILARRINKEAKDKKISDPIGLTILAALFLPVIALLTYLFVFLINKDFGRCGQQTFTYTYGSTSYQLCSNPADKLYVLVPLGLVISMLVLYYLYARVRMKKPILRAALVTVIIWIAFGVEFVGGAFLILSSAGIGYVILIPVLYAAVVAFYEKKILHQTFSGLKKS